MKPDLIKRRSEATSTNIQYKIYNIQLLTLASKIFEVNEVKNVEELTKPTLAAFPSDGV